MGGNALKTVKTVRIDLLTYNKIKKEIYDKINNDIQIEFLFDNPDKIDFGDLDILYKSEEQISMIDYITKIFTPIEIVKNGDVISFSYNIIGNEYAQIDFIKTTNFSMSKFFFSYGDLGLLIGKMARHHELSFGDRGLFIKNIYNQNIYLSDNPKEICDYLNLDYTNWSTFKSEIEIFTWLSTCNLCYQDIFISGNYEHRHRIETRPMYNRFIEWLNINMINKQNIMENKQNDAILYFNKQHIIDELEKENMIKQERKTKFNGKKILELNVINNEKELGVFIKNFKEHIKNKYTDFDIWLDNNTSTIIDNEIINFNQNYLSLFKN